MAPRAGKPYDFYAEAGKFRYFDASRGTRARIIEFAKDSVRLFEPGPDLWGILSSYVRGILVGGTILGGLTFRLVSSSGPSIAYLLLGVVGAFAVAVAFVTSVQRLFVLYLRSRSRGPPDDLRIVNVEFHRLYHRLVVRAGDSEFELYVAALPARLRRALGVSGQQPG